MNAARRMALWAMLSLAPLCAAAGGGRYSVRLRLLPGDEPGVIAQQIAAVAQGSIEAGSEGEEGFVLVASDAAVSAVRSLPRVAGVQALAGAAPGPLAPNGTSSWTTGNYVYDGSGNIQTIGSEQFRYDAFGRITSGTAGAGHAEQYTYDRWGNLLTITTDGLVKTIGVNPATNRADDPTKTHYGTYDDAGRMTSTSAGHRFVYDGLDVVTESTVNGTPTVKRVHLYNASDERVATATMQSTSGTGVASWEWTLRDPAGKVLRRVTKASGGALTWSEDYIYRGEQMLAADVSGTERRCYFHLDHLGTPRLITGNGGVKLSEHTYYPFGMEATSSGQDTERKKFTGHERDAETLDYMHARYYGPAWGRFLSVDPKLNVARATANPQLWNRYSYAANNPLKFLDPDGREITIAVQKVGNIVNVNILLTVEVHNVGGVRATASQYRSDLQGAANILSGTFRSPGHNTMRVTTTIDAIFTDKGGTDKSRHQIEVNLDRRNVGLYANGAEVGGNQMFIGMPGDKEFAHEMGHWLGLANEYEYGSDAVPPGYEENLMNNDPLSRTLMMDQMFEILRAYRENELNQGIQKK